MKKQLKTKDLFDDIKPSDNKEIKILKDNSTAKEVKETKSKKLDKSVINNIESSKESSSKKVKQQSIPIKEEKPIPIKTKQVIKQSETVEETSEIDTKERSKYTEKYFKKLSDEYKPYESLKKTNKKSEYEKVQFSTIKDIYAFAKKYMDEDKGDYKVDVDLDWKFIILTQVKVKDDHKLIIFK